VLQKGTERCSKYICEGLQAHPVCSSDLKAPASVTLDLTMQTKKP